MYVCVCDAMMLKTIGVMIHTQDVCVCVCVCDGVMPLMRWCCKILEWWLQTDRISRMCVCAMGWCDDAVKSWSDDTLRKCTKQSSRMMRHTGMANKKLRNFMPPKRRFWKKKQGMKSGPSIDFSMVRRPNRVLTPAESDSKTHTSSFVTLSKIFVGGHKFRTQDLNKWTCIGEY